MEELYKKIESAIDTHPGLVRVGEPSFVLSRTGAIAQCPVVALPRDKRRRPHTISSYAETPEEAATELVASLDAWSAVLKR